MKLSITITAVLIVTALLLSANKVLPAISVSIHELPFVNGLLKYQIYALLLAFICLFITWKVSPGSRALLQSGDWTVIAEKEKWLGINGKTSWRTTGIQLLFFISLATGIFMFLAVKYTDSLNYFKWQFLPLVLLLSLCNSFSEEIIYRFAILGNLQAIIPKTTILLISAVMFGFPHYFGNPSGIIGVLMSGLLGYILAKATHETQGLGIAWTIHFVQDVIIFTALFMMNMKA